MISIYGILESTHWDEIVMSFEEYDVYYLSGYVKAFKIHGDGEPQLLYYESGGLRAIYVYLLRDTAVEGLYDSVTPYGYGGVLFEGVISKENLQLFWNEYVLKMRELNIVDNFVRYHPILCNAFCMKAVSEVIDLSMTVAMDLSSPSIIWENIVSQNRNIIRKAEKNGVEIWHGKNFNLFRDFIRIYNETMDRVLASKYYYFDIDFYRSIHEDLNNNYKMFYATYNGQIIAMAIILFANNLIHYHLSGALHEYRNLGATNLLLYRVALWGCERGFKKFHLGGGVGSVEDNLYKFKASFNRNSKYQFSIAKHIFDKEKYALLIKERATKDPNFNINSSFFPLYRCP